MPTATLRTTLTKPPEPPNTPMHWAARARIRRDTRWEIMLRARGAGIPCGLDHITVTVHHRPATRAGIYDRGNLFAACKPIWDGLHGHRENPKGPAWPIVADDNPDHMRQEVQQHAPERGRPAEIWVTVTWTEPPTEEDIPC